MLDHADRVVFLSGGRVRATGTHAQLLESSPGYRSVVLRGEEP
jgi:ABC-type multidrug transport system fused ATPase/permease subunit